MSVGLRPSNSNAVHTGTGGSQKVGDASGGPEPIDTTTSAGRNYPPTDRDLDIVRAMFAPQRLDRDALVLGENDSMKGVPAFPTDETVGKIIRAINAL